MGGLIFIEESSPLKRRGNGAVEQGNHHDPAKKHPYRFYWLTAGLAAIIVAIITVSAMHSSGGSGSSPGGSGSSTQTSSNTLLTSADMEQAAGGSWQPLAANPDRLRFSCFPLPANPSTSKAVELAEALGAQFYEVVDSFPSAASASQVYTSFTNTTNNCSWQHTNNVGTTSQFNVVPDSNAPNVASASSLWDIQGAPMGSLNVAPSHDGAVCAVQSGSLVAFAWVNVDTSNSPSMTVLENNIEPTLGRQL